MKKLSALVFSFMLMLALPMVASANAMPDPSPTGTQKVDPNSSQTSPKTGDNSAADLAMVILLASGATACVSWKKMKRA